MRGTTTEQHSQLLHPVAARVLSLDLFSNLCIFLDRELSGSGAGWLFKLSLIDQGRPQWTRIEHGIAFGLIFDLPGHNAPHRLKLLNFSVYLILALFSTGPAFSHFYQSLCELSKIALFHDRNWLIHPSRHPEKAKVTDQRAGFCNCCLQSPSIASGCLCGSRNLGVTSRSCF